MRTKCPACHRNAIPDFHGHCSFCGVELPIETPKESITNVVDNAPVIPQEKTQNDFPQPTSLKNNRVNILSKKSTKTDSLAQKDIHASKNLTPAFENIASHDELNQKEAYSLLSNKANSNKKIGQQLPVWFVLVGVIIFILSFTNNIVLAVASLAGIILLAYKSMTDIKLFNEAFLRLRNRYQKYDQIVDIEDETYLLQDKLNNIQSQIERERDQQKTIKQQTEELIRQKKKEESDHQKQLKKLDTIHEQKAKKLRDEIKILEEARELQDIGFYELRYDFIDSEAAKAKLSNIREQQKTLVKTNKAINMPDHWTVNGSLKEGKKMIKGQAAMILRAFNGECDAAVASVNYRNVQTYEKRIEASYKRLNKMAQTTECTITSRYLKLKQEELDVAYEYHFRKQEEKEEQREIREQMQEEERYKRDIERAEKRALDEEKRYQKALKQAQKDLAESDSAHRQELQAEVDKLLLQLSEATAEKERAKSQAQLTKIGHVYIISNVGSFGNGVYKIGMTRRLVPEDRVKELGDASVPFPFDVHGMIFSTDAPRLESLLHRYFADRRVNKANTRKEFFTVDLPEIEEALASIQEEEPELTNEFEITHVAKAEEYTRSQITV